MSHQTNLTIDPFVSQTVAGLHQVYPTAQHQLIIQISNLTYSIEDIHFIAKNMYHVVKNFPRFLSAITANMDDFQMRMPLIENLFEEHGRMNPAHVHLQSYLNFLKQIGISSDDLEGFEPCAGVVAYVRSVLDLCLHYHYLEGLAALGIIEDIVHQVSPIIGQTTKKHVSDVGRVAHFTEHEILDEQHSQEIYALLHYSNEQEKQLIRKGLTLGAYYHSRLYTDIADEIGNRNVVALQNPANLGAELKDLKLDKIHQDYPLAEGQGAIRRLELLNNLYNQQSIAAIKNCIHTYTEHILEVGCGTGTLAHQLAHAINPTIRVLATDASQAQIDVAQSLEEDVINLQFAVMRGQDVAQLQKKFDIIYLRWVLIYQNERTETFIQQLYQALKPGGYLIIEDNNPVDSGCHSYECPQVIEQWKHFFKLALTTAGQVENLEKSVIDIYQNLPMQEVTKAVNQGALVTAEEKAVFYLGVKESKHRILEAGISEEWVDRFMAQLKNLSQTQYPIDFVKNFQLIGRKPSN